VTRIAPLVGFVRKESFVRSLVTVQGRYRTRTQRYSVRIYVAFWPVATNRGAAKLWSLMEA
jgi:hypothetical protein